MVSKLDSDLRKEFNQFKFKTNVENNVKKYLPQILIYGAHEKKINTQFASSTLAIKLVYVNQVYAILQEYGYVKIHQNKSGLNKGMQVCDILYQGDDLKLIIKLGFMNLKQLRKIDKENHRKSNASKTKQLNQSSAPKPAPSDYNDDDVLVEDSPLQDLFYNVGNALKKQPLQNDESDTSNHPLMDWLDEMGQGDEIRPFLESLTAMLADSSANDDTDVAVCDSMESVRHEASSMATQSSKVAQDSAKASVAESKSSQSSNQLTNNASDLPFTPESNHDEFEFNNGQKVDDVNAGEIEVEGLSDGLDDEPVQADFENLKKDFPKATKANDDLDTTFQDIQSRANESSSVSNEEFMETLSQFLDDHKSSGMASSSEDEQISTPLTEDDILTQDGNEKFEYPKDLDADALNQTDAKDFSDALNADDDEFDDNQLLDDSLIHETADSIQHKRLMLKQLLANQPSSELIQMVNNLSSDELDRFIDLVNNTRYAEVTSDLYNRGHRDFEDNLTNESATPIAPLESLNQDLNAQEAQQIENYPVSMPETFVQPSLNQYIDDNFVIHRYVHLDDMVSLKQVDTLAMDTPALMFDIISQKDNTFKITNLTYQQLMQTVKLLYRSAI